MITEMNAAQIQTQQIREQENATANAATLQIRRLELEGAAGTQLDRVRAEAVVHSIEARAQANVSGFEAMVLQHSEQQVIVYQRSMQEMEQHMQADGNRRLEMEVASLRATLEGALAKERTQLQTSFGLRETSLMATREGTLAAERTNTQSNFVLEEARLQQHFETLRTPHQ